MDFQAFLITLREALEAILIVGLILSYLTRLNAKKYHPWVFAGVGLALVSSYVVALLFQVVFTGFASFGSETYLKIGIMFASVFLLSHMVMWMTKESKNVNGDMQKKINAAVTAGSVTALVVHTYLIVLREGVETVFFFAAISGGDIESVFTSYGALSGLMLALILGYLFFTGTMKFSLKTFFRVTGIMIMFIAAGLLVQGVGMLQDLGKLGSVYETVQGEPKSVYNIVGFMPEHYQDEVHYVRDTGEDVVISGQIGLFLAAMFGYSHNPTVEQIAAYWLYFAFIIVANLVASKGWLQRKKKETEPEVQAQQAMPREHVN
ncbi:iron permease [Pontibacillus halophilus JSM 076056 = DSM 19796]|uniref:Iron permease n=1 Tax=Pontibacillus halophilus JSM 076056 = DSM 19796 TaxID=1385510 RepID=A0A0A5GJL2_9BACI|nr:FTR1 family protein [Pontibacillus halophilus]KGX93436.1 iron permease [Pontibacillus halophilus JSM 076056 = DSM 19796]